MAHMYFTLEYVGILHVQTEVGSVYFYYMFVYLNNLKTEKMQ